MAKKHTPKDDDEKIVKENIQKRFKNMFSGKGRPLSNMSIEEVESLKSRVAELETRLVEQQAVPAGDQPAISTMKPVTHFLPDMSAEAPAIVAQEPGTSAHLQRLISLWVTGISAAVGLAFFGVAVYIVIWLQAGMMELSDKVLMPYTAFMFVANLIALSLARRDRSGLSVWISYLTNVIVGPILVVLVLQNFYLIMGGYLVMFALLFIALILPQATRLRAIPVAIAAMLVMTGIEALHPAFRLSTSHIQNFTLMVLGPAAVGLLILFIVARRLRNPGNVRTLAATLSIAFFTLSVILLLINAGMAAVTNYLSYQETLSIRQLLVAHAASTAVTNSIQEKFSVLETAAEFGNPITTDPEVAENTLESLLGLQPSFRQLAILNAKGQQTARVSRQSSALAEQFTSRLAGAVLTQTKEGQKYISPVYIDDATSEPQVIIAVPIQNVFGDFQGVLAAELNLKFMWDLVDQLEVGETGYAYVVDNQGTLIAFGDTARVLRGENVKQISEVQEFLENSSQTSDVTPELSSYAGLLGKNVVGSYVPLGTPAWAVVTELPTTEAYQPILRSLLTSGAIILAFAILVGLAGNFLARRLSTPLIELSNIATEISSGNLGLQAKVTGPAEIAQVASTFNTMTSRLREFISTLEKRVADRTHDLELASEVGRTATEKVMDLSGMLTEAAEMIRTRFGLYYTQIYLTDPVEEKIALRAGTGEVGKELLARGHFLLLNTNSLNGRAAVEKQAQIVLDTAENPNFLPNPLLPHTRSEMSIPLIVGGKVVGVLDMQSEQPGALSESNLPAFETLAGQLAIAIQNAALFAEAQAARSEAEAQVYRFTKQGWQEFLDGIHQGHRIGFAFDESKVTRLKPEELSTRSDTHGFQLPITLTGTKIGEIRLPADANHSLEGDELELVQNVAAQLAQHVENLRLLGQAEQYREEAEQAVRRLTHEGWDNFMETHSNIGQGYTFNLTEVKPLSEKNHDSADYALKYPMAVGDEVVGELAVNVPQQSSEAAEILAAVSQQLSSHIENLRLSELNEKNAQREQTLRQITSSLRSSNNPTVIMRTAVRELGRIMGRRAVVQLISSEQADPAKPAGNDKDKSDTPAHQS